MDTEKVNQLCQDIKPDIIVWSLASKKNEVLLSETGLSNLLRNTPAHVRFIYISTTFSSDGNQKEDYLPIPVSENEYLAEYVNGKIIGEELTRTKQNHVIIRTGQIFGFDVKGKPDIRMKRLLAQKNLSGDFYRTANNRISITHVEDLAECILELCFSEFIGTINIYSLPHKNMSTFFCSNIYTHFSTEKRVLFFVVILYSIKEAVEPFFLLQTPSKYDSNRRWLYYSGPHRSPAKCSFGCQQMHESSKNKS